MSVDVVSSPAVQGSARDQGRDGCGKGGERGSKIADRHALPEGDILRAEAALHVVELAQELPHLGDRLGARTAEGGGGRDRLLDGIDRGRVGDDEGNVDPDEHDEDELAEAAKQIRQIGAHDGVLKRFGAAA